jgi:hypothetical protein
MISFGTKKLKIFFIFVRFPKDETLSKRWLHQIRRENFVPSKWTTVCSDHFEFECFIVGNKNRFLRKGSIPTLFPSFPSHLQTKSRKRKEPFVQSQSEVKKKKDLEIFVQNHDHCYGLPSQIELKKRIDKLIEENNSLKRKLKIARQSKKHFAKKCKSLKNDLKSLKEKILVSESFEETLKSTSSKVPFQLFNRLVESQRNATKKTQKYSKELRSFAVTLQFYSAKAYNFIRETFGLCLPHEKTVQVWYSSIVAEPGFTPGAFETLEQKVLEEKEKNKEVIVNLVFDEVSIKKKIEFDGRRFVGCTNLGTGDEPDDSVSTATEALVLMVVALDSSWKLTIGYFLIAHLNASGKSIILRDALKKLFEIKVKTVNVTCDGLAANFSTFCKFGASFDPAEIKSTFPHPSDPSQQVAVMIDACHLLKLVRNTFSDYKVLRDPDGEEIRWDFLQELHKIQEIAGLRAGNKLSKDHLAWKTQKMKVSLAAQTLSSSVADAIDFGRDHQKLPQFQSSKATTKFIRLIDRLFDVMNSRNPLAHGFKSPMKQFNEAVWSKVFSDAIDYLTKITDAQGKKLVHSGRKTAFIGFLTNIHSLQFLYKSLVVNGHMKYLLTYKLSQDHLELYFSALRCRMGGNNNPSSREFKAAYKRLLLHQEIRGQHGNCMVQDDTSLLSFCNSQKCNQTQTLSDFSLQKKFGLAYDQTDHDYAHISCFPVLSEFQSSILEYICGYVVRMASKLLHCMICLDAIHEHNTGYGYGLVLFKDRGGLIHVSPSVRVVCEVTEQAIQTVIRSTPGIVTYKEGLTAAITSSVLKNTLEKFP